MRISDWSSDVCSSDLIDAEFRLLGRPLVDQCAIAAVGRVSAHARLGARVEGGAALGQRAEGRRDRIDRRLLADVADDPNLDRAVREAVGDGGFELRSEEHTSELQSLMRISYAVFCLQTKNTCKQSQS